VLRLGCIRPESGRGGEVIGEVIDDDELLPLFTDARGGLPVLGLARSLLLLRVRNDDVSGSLNEWIRSLRPPPSPAGWVRNLFSSRP
jgi:hypothetical protein